MDNIVIIGQFLLSLSILIILHELGHFAPAKWFKTRVEKFYLFFDPYFELFKKKIGETEYGIGWLPLGGYVKISGMVDESMDIEQMKLPPQPWEFRSKPAWQRLIIMLGGVIVNFILGFFLFGMILFYYGKEYIPTSQATYGMHFDSLLIKQGFREGDLITKIGDTPVDRVDPGVFVEQVVLKDVRKITVNRNGATEVLALPADISSQITKAGLSKKLLYAPRVPFILAEKTKGGGADRLTDLQVGDQIVGLDTFSIDYFDQFSTLAARYKGKTTEIRYKRGDEIRKGMVTFDDNGKIGAAPSFASLTPQRQKYSLGEAIPGGFNEGVDFLMAQMRAFKKMFSGELAVKDNLGSVISISKMFGTSWIWERFWTLTASLSILLGFMNLLPIPGLDGGYVIFLLWEVFTGRKVSDKFMEKAVSVGFVLLMGLMIYAFGLDIWRNFIK